LLTMTYTKTRARQAITKHSKRKPRSLLVQYIVFFISRYVSPAIFNSFMLMILSPSLVFGPGKSKISSTSLVAGGNSSMCIIVLCTSLNDSTCGVLGTSGVCIGGMRNSTCWAPLPSGDRAGGAPIPGAARTTTVSANAKHSECTLASLCCKSLRRSFVSSFVGSHSAAEDRRATAARWRIANDSSTSRTRCSQSTIGVNR